MGIRTDEGGGMHSAFSKPGAFYLEELTGPPGGPQLIAELVSKGVRIHEGMGMVDSLQDLPT